METLAFVFLSFLLGIFFSQNFIALLSCSSSIKEAYGKMERFLNEFLVIGFIYTLFLFIIEFLEQPVSKSALAFGLLMLFILLTLFILLIVFTIMFLFEE